MAQLTAPSLKVAEELEEGEIPQSSSPVTAPRTAPAEPGRGADVPAQRAPLAAVVTQPDSAVQRATRPNNGAALDAVKEAQVHAPGASSAGPVQRTDSAHGSPSEPLFELPKEQIMEVVAAHATKAQLARIKAWAPDPSITNPRLGFVTFPPAPTYSALMKDPGADVYVALMMAEPPHTIFVAGDMYTYLRAGKEVSGSIAWAYHKSNNFGFKIVPIDKPNAPPARSTSVRIAKNGST